MENTVFTVFITFCFVVVYGLIGWSLRDLFNIFFDLTKVWSKILSIICWPILFVSIFIAFIFTCVSFIFIAIVLTIFLLGALLYNIIKSLIKGEKIDWDKKIF